jgi:tight adherence protein B
MMWLTLFVFVCVFAVAALLGMASDGASSSKGSLDRGAQDAKRETIRKKDRHLRIGDFQKIVLLSAIPWLNRWLQQFELGPRLRMMLYQANLKWTAGTLLLLCMTCFILPYYLVSIRTGSVMFSLIVGVVVSLAPFAFVLFKRMQRFDKFEQELPVALDLMVSALRAGHSFNAALGVASTECAEPVRGEFKLCFDEQNYGLELGTAMGNMVNRVPLRDLSIATTAILIQKESGGNLAEVLDKTAEVIRQRFRLRRQVKVHTAHGRMTGVLMTALPPALLIILYIMNPQNESILWTNPVGIKLLEATAGMMIVGSIIIQRIVSIDV